MRKPCLLLFALALAGCGPAPTWHKDGVDEMTGQRDLSACRQQAEVMYGAPGATLPSAPIDPRFGPTGPSPADRAIQVAQAVNGCMRGKGYVLQAADKK
jgi:hypothetical protein